MLIIFSELYIFLWFSNVSFFDLDFKYAWYILMIQVTQATQDQFITQKSNQINTKYTNDYKN